MSLAFCHNSDNFPSLDEAQVKLFPNFTRNPFDYLLMYQSFLNDWDWFILSKTGNIRFSLRLTLLLKFVIFGVLCKKIPFEFFVGPCS